MDSKILVTYASKYGATREIAEKIAAVLRQAHLAVDVRPVVEVQDLLPYRAVILGSALYIGKWPKEAATFLKANEKSLAARQVWLFSSGPTGTGDPLELVGGVRIPPDLQETVARINPGDAVVFHGHINPARVNFMEKFAVQRVVKKPFGDYRDWKAIEAWAASLAAALQPAAVAGG